MFALCLSVPLSIILFFFSPPPSVGSAQLSACSFLIIQKRTVWNTLSSPGRKLQAENNFWTMKGGDAMSLEIKSADGDDVMLCF